MAERPISLVAGIGEGLGASLATTFAAAGYDVVGLSRSARLTSALTAAVGERGGSYAHLAADLTREAEVTAAVAPVAKHVQVLVYAAHALVTKPLAETTPEAFEAVWRVGCLGAMLLAKQLAPAMVSRGGGTIIFTGATASIKGGARFSAFASAKFALRGFAQALARELGSQGVHVAHVLLDGLLDEPQTTVRFGSAGPTRMDTEAVAATYVALARQHKSAWSHEVDLRPFSERF